MDETVKQQLFSAIRGLLTAAGGWLVGKGIFDTPTMNQVVGAIMVILPIAWGVWDKARTEAATKVREANALNIGIMTSNQDPNQQTPLVPIQEAPRVIAAAKGTV